MLNYISKLLVLSIFVSTGVFASPAKSQTRAPAASNPLTLRSAIESGVLAPYSCKILGPRKAFLGVISIYAAGRADALGLANLKFEMAPEGDPLAALRSATKDYDIECVTHKD